MTIVVDLPTDLPESEVGGKALGLSALLAAGAQVPPGFVVLARALDEALVAAGDPARLSDPRLTDEIASEVGRALRRLGPGPVAVRSSGLGEDGQVRSFAGIHDTFLWVEGLEDVLAAIRRCWVSPFSRHARAYRDQTGTVEPPRLAVVVQRMVAPQVAGVAFSCDPVARRRDRVVVEAVPGCGDALVSGRATPDRAVLDRTSAIVAFEPAADRKSCLDAGLAVEIAGRVYFNVNLVMAWLRALPGMRRRSPVDLARFMGGDQQALAEATASLRPEDLPVAHLSS